MMPDQRVPAIDAANACSLCGGTVWAPLYQLRDNRTGSFDGTFAVSRCVRCGLISLRDRLTAPELWAGYGHGYGPYPPMDGGAARIDGGLRPMDRLRFIWHLIDGMATVDRLPFSGRVLDIGAGRGDDVASLRRRGIDAVGLEPIPAAVEAARAGGIPVLGGTIEDADLEAGSFDGVLLNQVVEHLSDPVEGLSTVRRLLRDGGTVAILTPNVAGAWVRLFGAEWAHWHVPFHLNLFGPAQLSRLLTATGFSVEHIRTVTPSFWLNMSIQAAARRSQQTGFILERHARQLPIPARLAIAPLVRLVDLAGAGDCLIAIAKRSNVEGA